MRCSEQSLHILGRAKGRQGTGGFHAVLIVFHCHFVSVHGHGARECFREAEFRRLTSTAIITTQPSRCFRFDWPTFFSCHLARYLTRATARESRRIEQSALSLSLSLSREVKGKKTRYTRSKRRDIGFIGFILQDYNMLNLLCGFLRVAKTPRKVTPVRNGTGEWEVVRTVDRKIKLIRWRCGRGGSN